MCFDQDYLKALQNSDPDAERQLISMFATRVRAKVGRRIRSQELAEDITQETLFRVLAYFRAGKTLRKPSSLPKFISSISINVSLEMLRDLTRMEDHCAREQRPATENADLERALISQESEQIVRAAFATLEYDDQHLMRRVFLEGADLDQLCGELHTSREKLRVLLFRAKARLKAAIKQERRLPSVVHRTSALPFAA